MKKIAFLLILALGLTGLYQNRLVLERILFEKALNLTTPEFFDGTLRLKHVHINREFKLMISGIKGDYQAAEGTVPLRIQRIESLDSLLGIFSKQGVRFHFTGLRPANSQSLGISGIFQTKAGKNWRSEMRADVQSLDLADIRWINPDNLDGSAGELRGDITFKADHASEPELGITLLVQEPGGKLQSKFFDVLLPYLPQLPDKVKIAKLADTNALVGFKEAELKAQLVSTDKIKVFLHILVPDYNLNLNLNLEIRVDEKNAFGELARIMGLVRISQ
jgi:hypothetical protein